MTGEAAMSAVERLRADEVTGPRKPMVRRSPTPTLVGMPSPAQMLSRFAAGFDLDALGRALGPEMAADLLDRRGLSRDGVMGVPIYELTMTRDQLGDLLGQAATRGVTRFLQAAELRCTVEGPHTGDDSYAALTATIESVRAATSLICANSDEHPQADRAAMAAQGVHLLLQLVHAWDQRGEAA